MIHPLIFSLAARKRVTESTNGFRAFRTAILRDPRIDWRQAWLDRYELEPYLMLKAIRLGYRHVEVPVTKIYPPHAAGIHEDAAVHRLVEHHPAGRLSGSRIEEMR